tara:strand:- start:958 stop:1221 length:264 start_codon:yes stop_codon:yes gene_type:complete
MEPTVQTTVAEHPDPPTPETTAPEPKKDVCWAPKKEVCCPLMDPPIFLPAPGVDLREVAAALLASFAMGATTALLFTYFSRKKAADA